MGFEKAFTTRLFPLLILGLLPGQLYGITHSPYSYLSYYDLVIINGTCQGRDSCSQPRFGDSPGLSNDYSCSCSPLCSKLDTCCIDSYDRQVPSPSVKPSCRKAEGALAEVFMVDRCPTGVELSPSLKSLCEEEWNGDDNVMMLVPVISLFSSLTYKNYFCFRCHELTDDFVFWNLMLRSDVEILDDGRDFEITYDRDGKTWLATSVENSISIPVKLQFEIPSNVRALVHDCKLDVISRCNDLWTDADVLEKCRAYTAIVYFEKENNSATYKNPHCALCNFESLDRMLCEAYGLSISSFDKKPFSFTHLLDINRSDGEKVGKLKKCEGNSVWDPYGRKCRKLSCAIPSYIIIDGKCAPS